MLYLRTTLVCLGLLLACYSFARDDGPVIPRGKGEQCVAETSLMRRNHMDYLLHQRDETVIKGLRDKPFSLVECVDCHARRDDAGKAIRVDAEGEFCQSCHTYAAVKIDCFSCHAAVPESGSPGHQPDSASLLFGGDSLTTLQAQLVEHLDGHNKQ